MIEFKLWKNLVFYTSVVVLGYGPSAVSQTKSDNEAGIRCDLNLDQCAQKPLTEVQLGKSLFLGDQVVSDLELLREEYLRNGQDLTAVIIARAGTNLDQFQLVTEKNGKESLQDMISRLIAETASSSQGHDGGPVATQGTIGNLVLRDNYNKTEPFEYSHAGIAFRLNAGSKTDLHGDSGSDSGEWRVAHLLYGCKKPKGTADESSLIRASRSYKDTVVRFFSDSMSAYRAKLVIPTQDVQRRLRGLLMTRGGVEGIREERLIPHYNALARYTDLSQANSNQFVLEGIVSVMKGDGKQTVSREEAIRMLTDSGFSSSKLTPTGLATVAVQVPFFQTLISNMMPTVCFKGQPELAKYGIGEVVTVNSVINWMKRNSYIHDIVETAVPAEDLEQIERIVPKPENLKSK
jgi:hypothetical protein